VRSVVTEIPLLPTRNPDVATPRHGRPAAELKQHLAASIDQSRTLIARNPGLDYASMVSEHPLTGATNVAEIFGFLALHERRHQSQMERVRRHPAFPR
jgi:hypothetical protein